MNHYSNAWQWIGGVLLLAVTTLAHAGALERLFAPKSEVWTFWNTQNTVSTLQVDNTAWSQFLQKYVSPGQDGIHRLDYANVSPMDRQHLEDYIKRLEQILVRQYPTNEKMAYWINLYNATTVSIILQHYPVDSIRHINISPGFFAEGPWGKKVLRIEEQDVSLNDIEHRILRPLWKDPRVHYALNCASLGCPNLQRTAFTADNIEQLLDKAAGEFINHPRGVNIDDGQLIVSSLFSWFQDDFGVSEKDVIQHLLNYALAGLAKQLQNINAISDDDYDWALNDLNPQPPSVNDY